MKNKWVLALLLSVLFQFAVLIGMYILSALPLWTGKEVKVKVVPVDPRSLFRGNYAQLRYDISQIDVNLFPEYEDLRNGEVVYVTLTADQDGLYTYSGVSIDKPETGIFIRGRIKNHHYTKDLHYFRLHYGIEAFFAPKEKALALEKQLRNGGLAVLMIADSGRARIKDVIPANS
jgi:uncharacterized membrane-anchored protein